MTRLSKLLLFVVCVMIASYLVMFLVPHITLAVVALVLGGLVFFCILHATALTHRLVTKFV